MLRGYVLHSTCSRSWNACLQYLSHNASVRILSLAKLERYQVIPCLSLCSPLNAFLGTKCSTLQTKRLLLIYDALFGPLLILLSWIHCIELLKMAGVEIHSASPLSSTSSEQSLAGDSISTQDSLRTRIDTSSTAEPDSLTEGLPGLKSESQSSQDYTQLLLSSGALRPADKIARPGPRINTGLKPTSTNTPLPWKIDETSSPSTPAAQARKASFAPPPRSGHRSSTDHGLGLSSTHTMPPLLTNSPSHVGPYGPSTPFPHISSPSSNNHFISPGYSQNNVQNARASFSDTSTNISPYANSSPFYHNYSYSSSISSPITPTRRGRGILDNDPDIYLRGEGDSEEETMWDTAAKWARAAGKRLSAGEQTIWKMVNAVANGDEDR